MTLSDSEVSRICAGLDEMVEAFRGWCLDRVEFPWVYVDATYLKVRNNVSRVVSMAMVVAVGVTADGHREILGCDLGDSDLLALVPRSHQLMADAKPEVLAFAALPGVHWQKIWSASPLERVSKEIKRRSRVVVIFPNQASAVRLVGAVLAGLHDEWQATERRCLCEHSMAALSPGRDTIASAELTSGNWHRGSAPKPTTPRDAPMTPMTTALWMTRAVALNRGDLAYAHVCRGFGGDDGGHRLARGQSSLGLLKKSQWRTRLQE